MRRDIFQAIADPTRRAILGLIARNAMTPNAIAEYFHTSRQAVSKHIQILNECNLLNQKQSGREIYYYFKPKRLKEVDIWLRPFKAMWKKKTDNPEKVQTSIKAKKK